MNRLIKRVDFLAAAKGQRAGSSAFLLQARNRRDDGNPRVGLTITKKVGNAVERNRIRRRLREAARAVVPQAAETGYDYVLVARRAALTADYCDLLQAVEGTLKQIHKSRR